MKFEQLNENCFYFHGAVNIGYVRQGNHGMVIDAGIDKSTMKKVFRQLEEHELPVTHLFITHAHADHYGGAQYAQEKYGLYTIAPIVEEAIMRNPILEPLYLFGGNDPLPELRNKFLEGPAISINQAIDEGEHKIDSFQFHTYVLPGHSYYQMAIQINSILFAADSYFSTDQLNKHKIPFITDASRALASLEKVKTISCQGAVPGHGVYEEKFHQTVDANILYHQQLINWLEKRIEKSGEKGISHEHVVADMINHYKVNTPQLSQWLLYRTAVTAYLLALLKQGKIVSQIVEGKWYFHLAD